MAYELIVPSPESSNDDGGEILDPLAVLLLTSHAHSPPLQPPPRLKYDLRSIDNPPKALRDSHTGVSKRLREHLLSHQDFNDLLDRVEADIRLAMSEALDAQDHAEAKDNEEETVLSVAAFCARGHHRSVAFVEELAAKSWPSGWEVRVIHRDLHKAKSTQKGKQHGRGGGSARKQVGGFDIVLGHD
ncbi:hypothetical protein B0H66DRAFT_306556 [Apodospora peruviana]|uniref:RapZ C-terminal domain-containing protein n=1 Tax=Apodospora peruviana TaxID=516989 RepID=A0AAE0M2Y6_9PEZI|nr:hypothetical protein B0H66DRAFT_306556 [Apodospora peruviana]